MRFSRYCDGVSSHLWLNGPVLNNQTRNIPKAGYIISYQNGAAADSVGGDHSVVVTASDPSALGDDLSIGAGTARIEGENRDVAQQDIQTRPADSGKRRVLEHAPFQFGEAQGRQQHRSVVLDELV